MKPRRSGTKEIRGNPFLKEEVHDPYHVRGKYSEPASCATCGAVYHKGRWQWLEPAPPASKDVTCPACRRIEDDYPAGEVILSGAYAAVHADELVRLVRNTEKAESAEHPLNRIMGISQEGDVITVTTTDVHLPRRIGHALENAWQGELTTHYDEDGWFARVTWRRQE